MCDFITHSSFGSAIGVGWSSSFEVTMKSLLSLLDCLLSDAERAVGTSLLRDRKTITNRVNKEGISFLTITLPTMNDWLLQSIEHGSVITTIFSSFKKGSESLPAFLQGLTSQIFDPYSGRILDSPNPDAVFFFRQITLFAKKIQLPCTEKRMRAAFSKYWNLEKELRGLDINEYLTTSSFRAIGRIVWAKLLSGVYRSDSSGQESLWHLFASGSMPFHSSGGTADCRTGNLRFHTKQWYSRSQRVFPVDYWGLPNASWVTPSLEFLDPDAEIPVKVLAVPKTLKTPRIIAEEPSFLLAVQQGVRKFLCCLIESDSVVGHSVHFTEQKWNRQGALRGSIDPRSVSTLDLSDASDRVTLRLVKASCGANADLFDALTACRSRLALVPGHGKLSITKYASMGSALCFPVEAMMFYIIALAAMHDATRTRPSFRSVKRLSKDLLVYGDDIVVPTPMVQCVMNGLKSAGLKVNVNKSFRNGKFRESCGMDAFDGTDVTPVYCRTLPSFTHHAGKAFVSTVELSNNLYKKGCWCAAQYVRDRICAEEGPLPFVTNASSVLGYQSYRYGFSVSGWDSRLQRFSVRGFSIRAVIPSSKASAQGALFKHFIKDSEDPNPDKRHLERCGRPVSVQLKRRWCTAR